MIPPNALPGDQIVTLTEVTTLSPQPPNQLVFGVGPSLKVTLAVPIQPRTAPQRAPRSSTAPTVNPELTTTSNIQFTINEQSVSVGLDGSVGLSTLTDTSGNSTFVTTTSTYDSTTAFASSSMSSSWLSGLSNALSSFGMGIVNSVMAEFPNLIPVSQLPIDKCWDASDPSNPQWKDFTSCSSQISEKKVLVVVHGMMSCVEEMTIPSSSSGLRPIPIIQGQDKYGIVVGFDYDWTQHLTDSGTQLASFLNELGSLGAKLCWLSLKWRGDVFR